VAVVLPGHYTGFRRRRRFGLLRRSPAGDKAAFWHFSPQRLVVALLARSADEPLLLGCASVEQRAQLPTAPFAAGLIEAARATSTLTVNHVVALDEHYCRLLPVEQASVDSVAVLGCAGLAAQTAVATVAALVELFADAQLRLLAVDSAECARMSLRQFLGGGGGHGDESGGSARADPLAAVSVLPQCEAAASELAALLAVPVGTALGWYGLIGDGDG